MTEKTEKNGAPTLRIEQVALLCGVSVARVHNWIEKNGLKFIISRGEQKVRPKDLAGFLMHYNMPIPGGILPINARKVLFICPGKRGKKAGNQFFRLFSEQFSRTANCFMDSVPFGKGAEYKILTFLPDLILADAVNGDEEAVRVIRFVKSIGGMRAVALVRRNLARVKRERILAAGADAVMERNTAWDELLACFNRVFNSLGNSPS
ncbi:MAG: helix-turn-helix domain-containing protein [Pseudomonadota bacterium]